MARNGMKAMHIMKKPAAAGTVAGRKRKHSEEVAGEKGSAVGAENKNDVVTDTHKDRGKQRYFDLNMHELPKNMLSLVQQARCQEKGRIINNMVYKDADGNYSFNLQNKYIDDKLCKYEDHFGVDGDICKPRGLAEVMWGGAEKLREAVDNTKIVAGDDNQVYYRWRELRTGKTTGCRRETHVGQRGEPDAKSFRAIVDKLKSMSWDLRLSKNEEKQLENTGELSEKVKERVEKAQTQSVKAVAEAEKFLKKIAGYEMTAAGEQAKKDMVKALKESIYYFIWVCLHYASGLHIWYMYCSHLD